LSNDGTKDEGAPTPQPNALLGLSERLELVGPTVDDDIRRAVGRYGAEAVKDAVRRQTQPKRGRKPEEDWPELRDVIRDDARKWLSGEDPFVARTNYAIAKEFAEQNPGQSPVSTHQRIERKLAKGPYNRRWRVLATAEMMSHDDFPHAAHIRAIEALLALGIEDWTEIWQVKLERSKSTIGDYERKFGDAPPANLSMKQIEEAARNALLTIGEIARPRPQIGGMFGQPRTS